MHLDSIGAEDAALGKIPAQKEACDTVYSKRRVEVIQCTHRTAVVYEGRDIEGAEREMQEKNKSQLVYEFQAWVDGSDKRPSDRCAAEKVKSVVSTAWSVLEKREPRRVFARRRRPPAYLPRRRVDMSVYRCWHKRGCMRYALIFSFWAVRDISSAFVPVPILFMRVRATCLFL